MTMSQRRLWTFTPLVLFGLLCVGCGSSATMTSVQPAARPAIDGKLDDWAGNLQKVEKKDFSLGIQNDGEFLYVALVSSEQAVTNEILRGGLTLWLDPAGGKEKVFGIRFPRGLMAGGGQAMRARRGRGLTDRGVEELFESSTGELQLMHNGEEGAILPSTGVPGIQASADLWMGTLSYELQIPLARTDEFQQAVDAAPGQVVGIGLETPQIDLNTLADRGGAGGARGGGGGRGAIGGGPPSGVARPQTGKPIKHWSKITLAG